MTRVFDEDLEPGFGTRALHAGQRPEPLAGAISKHVENVFADTPLPAFFTD